MNKTELKMIMLSTIAGIMVLILSILNFIYFKKYNIKRIEYTTYKQYIEPISQTIEPDYVGKPDSSVPWEIQTSPKTVLSIMYPKSWSFMSTDNNEDFPGSYGDKILNHWIFQKIMTDKPNGRLQISLSFETNPLNRKYSFQLCYINKVSCSTEILNGTEFVKYEDQLGISYLGGKNGKILYIQIAKQNASDNELDTIKKMIASIKF
jgi:hypothetical protein